ncbi:DNA-protecting protein DprA [Winogradskyella sp. PAMC22761]|nr:DNA-protecting protein DprA [Winogradskyella sp. PAMC22761]
MLNLLPKDIIYLVYLTNYDIRAIYSFLEDSNSREEVFSKCFHKMKTTDKQMKEAVNNCSIAIDKLSYHDIKTITFYEDEYPDSLKKIKDAPPILYVKGTLKDIKMAAVVGSRDTSKYAEKITREIVSWLNEIDFGVVSGLALGIDSFAHKYACKNSQYNLSVLPHSLDSIYPKENYGLAKEIIDRGGCLVSENIFNINRGKRSFVQRNRIQSALSDIVIPIEMGINSGTMHTINFAERYDKLIMVLKPTPMLKDLDQYSGINEILQKKSKVVPFTSKDEFIEIIRVGASGNDNQTSMEL